MSEEGDKTNSTTSEGKESIDKDDDSCSQDSAKSVNNDKKDSDKNNKEKSEDEEEKVDKNNGRDEKDDKKANAEDDEDEDSEESVEPVAKKGRNNVVKKGDKNRDKSPKIEGGAGKGVSLGDIPRIDASISRFKNDDLKMLHELLYDSPGKTAQLRKNIKKFNGFEFAKDSDDYKDKLETTLELESKQLRVLCEMLELPREDSDEDNAKKVLDFLLEPKDTEKKQTSGGRPKRTAAVKANNRGYSSHDDYSSDEKYKPRSRRDKGQRASLKEDSFSGSDEEFNPSDDEERPPARQGRGRKKKKSESEDSIGTPSSDESDSAKKKKKGGSVKSTSKAKTKAAPAPTKRGRKPNTQKKAPGRKKKKVSSDEDNSLSDVKDEDSSEDEPLVKKAKTAKPPTDDDLKSYVKEILDGANLEEITMKTVCQKVYDHYPDFDLAHKKDFIKSTVKSLITT